MNLHIRQATPDDLLPGAGFVRAHAFDESLGFERHGDSFLIEI